MSTRKKFDSTVEMFSVMFTAFKMIVAYILLIKYTDGMGQYVQLAIFIAWLIGSSIIVTVTTKISLAMYRRFSYSN
jgi:hypothetical protein